MSESRRYGEWAGDPKGTAEDPTRCVKEVWPNDRAGIAHQCFRKRGHGEGGLYCAQHAGDGARALARNEEFERRKRESEAIMKEAKRLGRLLGVEITAEYNGYSKPPQYVELGVISFEDLRILAERLGRDKP